MNRSLKRAAHSVPTTIEELRAYCRHHNLPLADTRVFLGEDYRGAKAFGIYRNKATGNIVVYKNTRAVRYEGSDEAYAVNELYLKIKERVAEQKRHLPPKEQVNQGGIKRGFVKSIFTQSIGYIIVCIIVFIILAVGGFSTEPSSGYYAYGGHFYYYDSSSWYEWDIYGEEWSRTQADAELEENADDYYQSKNWSASYEAGDFTESSWYSEEEWEDDDWDDDWDDSYDDHSLSISGGFE